MKPVPANPAYRIITPRLVLRCYEPTDAPLFLAAVQANIEHLTPFMPWAQAEKDYTIDDTLTLLRSWRSEFDAGKELTYAIFNADESEILGSTGLHVKPDPLAREIGYWVHKDHLNKGIASEAAAALTRVSFEVYKLERIEIHCAITNLASASVPRKLGYTHEATRRRLSYTANGNVDHLIWTLFADEYPKTPCAHTTLSAYDALNRQLL